MKKTILALLLAAAFLSLAACGRGSEQAAEPSPSPSPNADELDIAAASDTDAAAARQSHVPPASDTDLQIDGAAFDKAVDCIGMTIFDLYAAIGQPSQTPVYTTSARQENAQDGTLPYKGFNVQTLRTSTQEIVLDVVLALGDADAPQPTQNILQADQTARG